MTESKPIAADAIGGRERERLLRLLAVTTFIVFFQAYMVAPVIPALSNVFRTSVETVGLIIPAYLIPYGIATLAYGPLADRIGIHRVMFASLAAFATLAMLTATAQSIEQLALWRIVTGIGASGVVPLAVCFPRTFEINRFRCARGSLSGGFVESIGNLPKRFPSPKCSCGLVSPTAAAATEWLWRVDVNV
jgi:MFS family permease